MMKRMLALLLAALLTLSLLPASLAEELLAAEEAIVPEEETLSEELIIPEEEAVSEEVLYIEDEEIEAGLEYEGSLEFGTDDDDDVDEELEGAAYFNFGGSALVLNETNTIDLVLQAINNGSGNYSIAVHVLYSDTNASSCEMLEYAYITKRVSTDDPSFSFDYAPDAEGWYRFRAEVYDQRHKKYRAIFESTAYNTCTRAEKDSEPSTTGSTLEKVRYLVKDLCTGVTNNKTKAELLYDGIRDYKDSWFAGEDLTQVYRMALSEAAVPNHICENKLGKTWTAFTSSDNWYYADITYATKIFGKTYSQMKKLGYTGLNLTGSGNYTQYLPLDYGVLANSISAKGYTGKVSATERHYDLNASTGVDTTLYYISDDDHILVDDAGFVTIPAYWSGTANIKIIAAAIGDYMTTTKTVKIKITEIANTISYNEEEANKALWVTDEEQTVTLDATAYDGAVITYTLPKAAIKKGVTVDQSNGEVTIPAYYKGNVVVTITAAESTHYKKATKKVTLKVVAKRANVITVENANVVLFPSEVEGGYQLEVSNQAGLPMEFTCGSKKVTCDENGLLTFPEGFSGKVTVKISTPATTVDGCTYTKTTKSVWVKVQKASSIISLIVNNKLKKSATFTTDICNVEQELDLDPYLLTSGEGELTWKSTNTNVAFNPDDLTITVQPDYTGTATVTITEEESSDYKKGSVKVVVKVSAGTTDIHLYRITDDGYEAIEDNGEVSLSDIENGKIVCRIRFTNGGTYNYSLWLDNDDNYFYKTTATKVSAGDYAMYNLSNYGEWTTGGHLLECVTLNNNRGSGLLAFTIVD